MLAGGKDERKGKKHTNKIANFYPAKKANLTIDLLVDMLKC